MYKCRYCGFVSNVENIRYCANSRCANYYSRLDTYTDSTVKVNTTPSLQEVSSKHDFGFATVPFQKFNSIMTPSESLAAGTVFAELSMPYTKKIIKRG